MRPDLHDIIREVKRADLSNYPDVTNYECALDAGLWVLWIYNKKLGQSDYLTSDEISEILDSQSVSFDALELTKAFARADKKIRRKPNSKPAAYKVMQKGIDYLTKKVGNKNIEVVYIEGSKPHTDRTVLKDIVSRMKGEVKVVDPYYGLDTLYALSNFDGSANVKLLSHKYSGKDPAKFSHELASFKKQYPNIELRHYPVQRELHDRYIITSDSLILLGHGIKDMGGRESFVLIFKQDVGKEIRADLSKKFDDRWQNSSDIT